MTANISKSWARCGGLLARPLHGLPALGEKGAAAVEFALIGPLFITIMLGAFQFGLAFYNFLQVGNSVSVGARTFAMARGNASPYTSTTSAMQSASASLISGNLTITLSVNGTACSTDSTCETALTQGSPATVTASYPCNLVIVGINFLPSCSLRSTTTGRVE